MKEEMEVGEESWRKERDRKIEEWRSEKERREKAERREMEVDDVDYSSSNRGRKA